MNKLATAAELFSAGDLDAAIEASANEVRQQPSNAAKRAFFVELLCFAGELERADKQLNALATLDLNAALTVGTWRQLIRAAQSRFDVFESGATPELISAPTPRIQNALALLLALRDGDTAECANLLGKVDQGREQEQFVINGEAVSTWRDLDDVNAGILEVLASNGKYFWVDFSQVAELRFEPAQRPIDLLWRKAMLLLENGSEGEVFIPAIYHSKAGDDPRLKLGRSTEWLERDGVVTGRGQRIWLVGDEAMPIMEISSSINSQLAVAVAE